ncbi:MAG: methylated-DNA--[protein]-cysteine S-methyltransferase [Deltaproteobacteria bacterium]|nr:methylated-DNA--[protein]-cysteine S-methyltransferase [Deltaproteobacteria bacterium]
MSGSGRPGPPLGLHLFETALGTCAVLWGKGGLRAVALPERDGGRLRRRLAQGHGELTETAPPAAVRRAARLVQHHLAGSPQSFAAVALDMSELTPFSRKIYHALRRTRPGDTLSYAELAARAGSPRAARAVGQAMARNPFALVVPCHRVLGAGGSAGGFSAAGGRATKAKLLALEGVHLAAARRPARRRSRAAGRRREGPRLFAGDVPLPFDAAKSVRALRRADPELGRLIGRVGAFGLRLRPARSTFEALAEAIVYQQLNGKAAASIYARLVAAFGRRGALSPGAVARALPEELRHAGLSGAKAAALRDLAERTLAGQIPSLRRLGHLGDEAIVEVLTAVRGVGRWTVQMLLIFQLGRPDVLPSTDFGIRQGFARAFGLPGPAAPAAIAARAERWRPQRSVASWYLWRALELPPEDGTVSPRPPRPGAAAPPAAG